MCLCAVVAPAAAERAIAALRGAGERAWLFGEVEPVAVEVAFEDRVRFAGA